VGLGWPIPTLLTGLSLVHLVSGGAKEASELPRITGPPLSTVHRLPQVLKSEGYLRDALVGLGLGPTLIVLGFNALSSNPLAAVATPHLDTLAGQVLDTVHMAVPDHGSVLYLVKIPGYR